MKDIVGSHCNEVGTPHLSSFELPRGTAFHGNTLFIHSLTCSWIRAKKIPWKNNEDFLIPTYLPTRLLHSYMIRDPDAHILLATSGFEKSRGIFLVFFSTIECSCLYPTQFSTRFSSTMGMSVKWNIPGGPHPTSNASSLNYFFFEFMKMWNKVWS